MGSKRYIRAWSTGKVWKVWPFYIKICGAETVLTSMPATVPPGPFYFYMYGSQNTGTNGKYLLRDSINDFSNNNNVNCPIMYWNI